MGLRFFPLRSVLTVAFFIAVLAGCGSNRPDVPGAVMVDLPDGTTVRATLGSGVISLASTEWDLYATSPTAQAVPFVRLRFNSNGSLRSFVDNTFAREIFGATILFDGKRHPTRQFGLEYSAGTFGAETSDAQGFAFEGRLAAFAGGLVEAATATASATGTFDPDDPNIIRGVLAYSIRVKIGGIPTPPAQEPINFVGYLVTDEDDPQDDPSDVS